jgi:hypothetical protein
MGVDNMVIDASGHTKKFISSGIVSSLAIDNGTVDFNQQTITSLGDFYAGPAAYFNRRGFNNSIINVSGNMLLVAYPNRPFTMHPDSASGSWQLNVMGTANAYYVSARVSDASRGTTITAYGSDDYGGNINWNFGGNAPSSGNLYLFLAGATTPVQSGSINLRIFGYTDNTTGNLFLYTSGTTPGTTSGSLYLWASGSANVINSDISIFMANSGVPGDIPVFIHGKDSVSDSVLYLVVQNDGFGSGITLYTQGSIPSSGNMDLVIAGSAPFTGNIDMFLAANAVVDGDTQLLETWRKLQTSDHFYYLCTKYWSDGDVHKYFSPYDSPYEAFRRLSHAIEDLRIKASVS